METATSANSETTEAWDGPLYDRFLSFREIIIGGVTPLGEQALRLFPPTPGQRVIDLGCGFGDTTQRVAGMVGPDGDAVGVDVAARFIETARLETDEMDIDNVRFEIVDVQTGELGGPYDVAFSRFGTMFYANPVAALRNVRAALVPGGRLVMIVWRRREDNLWMYRAQQIVEGFVTRPEEYDDPTCGPGPFSMAGADTTTDVLVHAGFTEIEIHRCDLPMLVGNDVEQAIDLVMSLGPAGEILRLQGDRAKHLHAPVRDALREGLSEFETPAGLMAPASTWIVSAVNPG